MVVTPHIGASTTEAQEKVALQIAEQMSDYLLTGAVSNAVNVPSVTAEEAPVLKPYMKLAELLGSFCGQMADGPIDAVSLELEGHAAALGSHDHDPRRRRRAPNLANGILRRVERNARMNHDRVGRVLFGHP